MVYEEIREDIKGANQIPQGKNDSHSQTATWGSPGIVQQ